MRIVIDMQGAQTESRFRGIGRYTVSMTQAIIHHSGQHEVILALNGLFPETIEDIRSAFDGLLPQHCIRVWYAPGPVFEDNPDNTERRKIAEVTREAFLDSLEPDVIHIHSLFEGYHDDAVLSIGRLQSDALVSVTLHDLIPLLYAEHYLASNQAFEGYYYNKLEYLRNASLLLAISESSKNEAGEHLGFDPDKICNTYEAAGVDFRPLQISEADKTALYRKCGLTQPFVLYTGGADYRKNLPRLIKAFAQLPSDVKKRHQLLLAGRIPPGIVESLEHQAVDEGLRPDALRFSGHVSEQELIQLYNLCKVYVFPTWHEGFGLPALEAMSCGAAVIGANTSSLPEVIGLDDALFDPMNVSAMSAKMAQALTDETFRGRLQEHGLQQAQKFSWDESARRAIERWEKLYDASRVSESRKQRISHDNQILCATAYELQSPSKLELSRIASSLALNQQAGFRRQLFLDISELRNNDAGTGVQRVVRSYLRALLQSPPHQFQVEPVYATREDGYRYASRFLTDSEFAAEEVGERAGVDDEPIHWQRGDVFFALDMQHHVQLEHTDFMGSYGKTV